MKKMISALAIGTLGMFTILPASAQETGTNSHNKAANYADCSMTCEDFIDMDGCDTFRAANPCMAQEQDNRYVLYFFCHREEFEC